MTTVVTGPIQAALDALFTAITAAVATLPANGPITPAQVTVVEGFITENELGSDLNPQNPTPVAVISIYDGGTERDVSRFITQYNGTSAFYYSPPPSLVVSPSVGTTLSASGKAVTYTFSLAAGFSAPNPTDSVTIGVNNVNNFIGVQAASYTVLAVDTLSSIATNFKNVINANTHLNTLVTASATGATLTITSTNAGPLFITLLPGVQGLLRLENRRTQKVFSIDYWCPSNEVREFLADWVDNQLNAYTFNLGLPTEDQNYYRMWYMRTILTDMKSERNLFRRTTSYRLELAWQTIIPLYTADVLEAGCSTPS